MAWVNQCFYGVSVLTLLFNFFMISADNSFTPRGVPLSRAALYDSQKDFVCLDGLKIIPFSHVNDDYCDCEDGSDEPGTSACSNGKFFCVNAGHISSYIHSSRVNDGICDCCDGSDEFIPESGCTNTCDEQGRAAREESERLAQLLKEGFQRRIEMSSKGKELRVEKEEERLKLEGERTKAEGVREEKNRVKEERESPEKEALAEYKRLEDEKKKREDEEEKMKSADEAQELFKLLDSNEDGKISIHEIKVRQTFDRNKDGEVSDEEAKFFLNLEDEMSKEDFLQNGYLLAKPYFLMEQGMFTPPVVEESPSPDEDEISKGTEEFDDDDEAEDNKEPQLNEGDKEEELEERNESSEEITVPIGVDNAKYDPATLELIKLADEARNEFHEAEKHLKEVTSRLEEVNSVLNLDFGTDERFAPLHGQCFDYEDREYVYSLCPFKEASQRGKNGGSGVNLGNWGSWTGGEGNIYGSMIYDKGQGCWNGPSRSAKVYISCGVENRLVGVSEPSRCEYRFEFISPTACENPETHSPHSHDEL